MAPPVSSFRSVQVPGGAVQLAEILEVCFTGNIHLTYLRWIDIRRDPEWVPSSIVPPATP
jgi:hypothetical protein